MALKTTLAAKTVISLLILFLAAGSGYSLRIPLTAREFEGYTRRAEPVTMGVILPRGEVSDPGVLRITGPGGEVVPCQFAASSTWPDGSTKWLLVDFPADCPAGGTAVYTLTDSDTRPVPATALRVRREADGVLVETGPARFRLRSDRFDLFSEVWLDHDGDGTFGEGEKVSRSAQGPWISAEDDLGRLLASRRGEVRSFEIEENGPVRATLAVKGAIGDLDGEGRVDYTVRLYFYAGTGFVRVFFTLANHNPTEILIDENGDSHWLLGRRGAFFFEDMSLSTGLDFNGPIVLSVGDGSDELLDRVVLTDTGGIYQESSGGENWFNRIHMNHRREIPMRFRGGTTFLGGIEPYPVERPDAWLHVADRRFGLAVGVRHFWQNFPKALTASPDGTVRVGLWPEEFPDLHELQGGEIKTHEIAFFFHTGPQGSTPNENRIATVMGAFHHPLMVRAPAETYIAGGFFDDAVTYSPKRFPRYEQLMNGAMEAQGRTVLDDIENREEYGWRHWGDTPALNEYDETGGPHDGRHAASHFNHEYDHGYGMLFHHLRTASDRPELSHRWWRLAEPALWHEADIDLYHTDSKEQAEGAFSGGKFAHTSHGVEVVTATHRGSPRLAWWGDLTWPWGQGQSPESGHFNNRGMMVLYYLTGNRTMLESALELADLVCYKITEDVFPQIDQTNRNSGNNLQILTDAYLLTWDEKYVPVAEKILETTGPRTQWYLTEQGRRENPDEAVGGYWQPAICINAVGRWTDVMEEKSGAPYTKGREYLEAYGDFAARFMAAGPEHGFWSSWTPSGGGQGGNLGPWTYRVTDVLMYAHKYSDSPEVRKRCLGAAEDAFEFMRRRYPDEPTYYDSKFHTILAGGGHEYTYFKAHGRWKK